MKKDKKLFRYLCEAFPYYLLVEWEGGIHSIESINCYDEVQLIGYNYTVPYYEIKPYLRSMDSMTSEEYDELCKYASSKFIGDSKEREWLIINHFDYMGLIPLGLAVEINDNNNPYKK